MDKLVFSRYNAITVILLLYAFPVFALSLINSASMNTQFILSLGLLLTAIGTFLFYWLFLHFENELQRKKVVEEVKESSEPESIPQQTPEPLFEAQLKNLEKIKEELNEKNQKLQKELEGRNEELTQKNKERDDYKRQIENVTKEKTDLQKNYNKLSEQNKAASEEHQKTMEELKEIIEDKQHQIEQLESKVDELNYEVRTILQISDKK